LLNIHHLELFYYVALHGGISSAVRHMPYGIQQPAVSGQIAQLERHLGITLFQRQPFRLTPAGQELLDFVQPFFGNLDAIEERLRDSGEQPLRIGASELVLRLHLPAVLERLRHQHQNIRLALRSGSYTELAAWLRAGEVDLIVTPLAGRPPAHTHCVPLLELPLVLQIPKTLRIRSAETFLQEKRISHPLISLPARETVSTIFQRELRRRGIHWSTTIEASSLELITPYVADGRGVGLNVMLPEMVRHPLVRVLPLTGFQPLVIAALWRGEPPAMVHAIVDEGRRYVSERWPQAAASCEVGSETVRSDRAPLPSG
jgi:DNA-binding transcriptional LysR family regulator